LLPLAYVVGAEDEFRIAWSHLRIFGAVARDSFAVTVAIKGSCGVSIESHTQISKTAATLARDCDLASPVYYLANSPMSDQECPFVPVDVCHGDFATLPWEPRCPRWTPSVPLGGSAVRAGTFLGRKMPAPQ
jgi:hypothetical protein